MKYFAQAAIVAALGLASCQSGTTSDKATADANAGNKDLNGLFGQYWEKQSRLDPLAATGQGDNRFNDQLPNDQT